MKKFLLTQKLLIISFLAIGLILPGCSGSGSGSHSSNKSSKSKKKNNSNTSESSSEASGPSVLSISDGVTYDFGSVSLGNTPTKTFTVSNAPSVVSATLGTIGTASLGLSAPYTLAAGSTCSSGGVLEAGESCTIVIQFAPVSAGVHSVTLELAYNDGTDEQSVERALTGAGQNPTTLDESGAGTPSAPYLIFTAAQLLDLMATSSAWNKHFRLGTNIDLSGYNETNGIVAIGSDANPFVGSFDGNNYSIDNLTYTNAAGTYAGLFGLTMGPAEITNLTLNTISIGSSASYTGGIAGSANYGTLIKNCHVTGSISTITSNYSGTGGIAGGISRGSRVSVSSSSVSVTGSGGRKGSFAGTILAASIEDSFASGSVTGGVTIIGGLIGEVGGGSRILNSYYIGSTVSGGTKIGGFAGEVEPDTLIVNSFATGNVSGSSASNIIGGFAGEVDPSATLTNNFRSSAATCDNTGAGNCNSHATAAAVADLQNPALEPVASWDQTYTWNSPGAAYPTHSLVDPMEQFEADGGCATYGANLPFAWGIGSMQSPYLICNVTQFSALQADSSYWNANNSFRLMGDIEMAGVGAGAFSIGNSTTPFRGWFDGAGYGILDFTNNQVAPNTGLFGVIQGGAIKNLAILNANITTTVANTGILAGNTTNTVVANVYTTGSIYGASALIGRSDYGTIANSYSTATIGNNWSISGITVPNSGTNTVRNTFFAGHTYNTSANKDIGPIAFSPAGLTQQLETYYDSSLECAPGGTGLCVTTGATGIDTTLQPSYFKDPSISPLDSWDFVGIWNDNSDHNGYPTLNSRASLTIQSPLLTYNYGNVSTASSSTYAFTVINGGNTSATLGTVDTAGLGLAGNYSLTGGSCSTGMELKAGASCTLEVTFAPASTGATSDTIDLSYTENSNTRSASRGISGTGI